MSTAQATRTRRAAGSSLTLEDISKRYAGAATPAVDALSLAVAAGEFVSLLGASGSGKTTTLMMVGGFTAPDRGRVWLGERPILHLPPERRGIGVVFQHYALFPHMSALRNVAFPLHMRNVAAAERRRRAEAALERVGLSGLGHRMPAELSGGQQQRVALARAIVFEPGLLLMDEPLGALDRTLREQMKAEIRRLHRELGITILYVTHDQEEALTLSDRIALMHQGRIKQLGTASDLYERPADAFVARFIGESTLIEGIAEEAVAGIIGLRPLAGGPLLYGRGHVDTGAAAVLLLRPEKLTLEPQRPGALGLAAKVTDLLYVGEVTRVLLTIGASIGLAAKLANRHDVFRPQVGDRVSVAWAADEALVLPADAARGEEKGKWETTPCRAKG